MSKEKLVVELMTLLANNNTLSKDEMLIAVFDVTDRLIGICLETDDRKLQLQRAEGIKNMLVNLANKSSLLIETSEHSQTKTVGGVVLPKNPTIH